MEFAVGSLDLTIGREPFGRDRVSTLMRKAPVVVAMFLFVTAPCSRATAQPAPAPRIEAREVAAEVAQAVDDNYFDVARGHTIAEGLRAKAQSGAYDGLTDPLDLATALSAYLHPFDGHFAVVYRPDAGPQGLPGGPHLGGPGPGLRTGPGPGPRPDPRVARENYGFGRIEMLPGGIGYAAVTQFAQLDPRSPKDPARLAADAALQSLAGSRAIILDLRDSRGGAPAMVAYLASYFVPADARIFNTFHNRSGSMSEAPVGDPTGPRRLETPLYILANGGTGSASESFSYTLQAARRAVIVGEPTNGRANPGGFVPVSNGFAVFVSGGSPENPITHTNWEGAGVQPDIAVASAEALKRAHGVALERLLAADPQGPDAPELRWLLDDMRATPAALGERALQDYAGSYGEAARVTSDDGVLVLHQGRRAAALRQVAADVFVSALDPLLHAAFERVGGRIAAVTLVTPSGPIARFTRARS